jgi:hypothetical protein
MYFPSSLHYIFTSIIGNGKSFSKNQQSQQNLRGKTKGEDYFIFAYSDLRKPRDKIPVTFCVVPVPKA